jgi:hypothetical protein
MARLEFYGALFTVALGSMLNFTYEAAQQAWWAGMFSAMNESVWEGQPPSRKLTTGAGRRPDRSGLSDR